VLVTVVGPLSPDKILTMPSVTDFDLQSNRVKYTVLDWSHSLNGATEEWDSMYGRENWETRIREKGGPEWVEMGKERRGGELGGKGMKGEFLNECSYTIIRI